MTPVALRAAARALALTARVLERELDDMTLPQYRVLTLVASSPQRAGRVAELASLSRPSLTGILDGLVVRGWIRRVEVNGDRRGVSIEATASGTQHMARAEAALGNALACLLECGDVGDAEDVLSGCAALGRALDARFDVAVGP